MGWTFVGSRDFLEFQAMTRAGIDPVVAASLLNFQPAFGGQSDADQHILPDAPIVVMQFLRLIGMTLLPPINMAEQERYVSPVNLDQSPATVENSSMSAADDVMEMRGLVGGIAELLTPSRLEKDRIAAVRGVFRDSSGRFLVSWNRTLEFLRGRARQVQNWEMRYAANKLSELRRLERQRREHDHLTWLDELISSDPALRGRSAADLQHLLRRDREEDRAMAGQGSSEGASR
jgi:hypothetical protein